MVLWQLTLRAEIVVAADRAAVFRARIEGAEAAAVHSNRAARREQAALALNVDDAGGSQPVLSRQGTGDKLHRFDKAGTQILPEKTGPIGDDHAIDAILHVQVFVADVEP